MPEKRKQARRHPEDCRAQCQDIAFWSWSREQAQGLASRTKFREAAGLPTSDLSARCSARRRQCVRLIGISSSHHSFQDDTKHEAYGEPRIRVHDKVDVTLLTLTPLTHTRQIGSLQKISFVPQVARFWATSVQIKGVGMWRSDWQLYILKSFLLHHFMFTSPWPKAPSPTRFALI